MSVFSFSQNPIVTENALAGNPKSEWDISGAGDLSIQGFATDISVNKGSTVRFKINAGAGTAYSIRIYRLGYYGGNGARLIVNLGSFTGTSQPSPSSNSTTGLVDCGNWSESASWAVPTTAVSGLYIAKLIKTSGGGSSHITFVVRDDARNSALLFKTSDATWQAYNPYGGASLYVGPTSYPNGHAVKVSYNRPFLTRNGGGGGGAMEDWFMNAEYPMIRFIERNGYDVTYTTDVDMDRDATPITPSEHKIILSVGHDEYWSLNERNKFEAARNAGVHLAFFSGNEVYWKTRWENSNRTLVCYKEGTLGENVCGNKCDPTSAWTGLWRDGGAYDAGKPENALVGQISWELVTTSITVPVAYKNLRFWRNTAIASATGTTTLPNGTLGYEADFEQYFNHYPSGRITLSNSSVNGQTHKLSLYRHSSGALVFGAGTVQWSWGLDNIHDRGSTAASQIMQQATVNLFADMGVSAGSLMSGLTQTTASTDFTAPTCVISSPAHNGTVPVGSATTISGTASDGGGGQLVGVEVSVNGGATWQAATGTSSWTFSWTPASSGTYNIRVRGFDDSGNMSVPGATGSSSNITVTAGGGGGNPVCPCNVFASSATPSILNENDGQGIEVGMKFRSSQAGYITGVRFYKGSSNTGTHVGHLWTSTGTKIGEVTFTNETASGWQQMLFSSPVAITANTTYVVSYWSASGWYSSTNPYFTSTITNGYLSALGNGVDGPNGLYLYTSTGAFPTSNWGSSNYFVDVVFQTSVSSDVTPPTVSMTAPAAGTVSGTINVTANAADNVGVAGVQFLLDGANLGAEDLTAPYSVSWNTATATNGSHELRARARDAAGNTATTTVLAVNVNNGADTQAPTVSITAPAEGSTVGGTVNITANAADNVGVVGVQFKLDGLNLGTEDVAAPYSFSWNTIPVPNGSHTLTAVARDAAGNTTTSAPINLTTFNNTLVLALGFNETSGTTAADISGNNNHGTLTNGPAWSASGRYGGAVLFDGTNDFVNIADANSLDLTSGMTIEAWVNASNLTGYKTVINKDRNSNSFSYTLAANNNASNAANQRPNSRLVNSGTRTVTGTSKLALNTWTHIASTYDGTTFRLYINGVQVSTLATTGNITVSTNPLRIGGTTNLSGQYFAGLIDEVRIYNRALSQAEIQTDMNTPIAPDNVAPTVNITAPAAGTVTGTINVTANAADNIGVTGVQFLLDGVALGAEDVAAPYSVSWNTTGASNGPHQLTARARDAAGNLTTAAVVAVTVSNDTQSPTVNITAPTALSTVNGTINVDANAADDVGVTGVQFLLDGVNLGSEDITAPYSVSWNTTTATEGNHVLTARARDAAGNITTSVSVTVTVDNIPPDTEAPTVNITAPGAGNVSGTINVTANATDNVGVAGVQFQLDGVNLGSEDLAAPYTVSWNTTTATNGTHTLTARARDEAGNLTTSAQVVVTVNNVPDTEAPAVNITSPSAGNVVGTINVNANASDNVGVVGVQFLLNGTNLGSEDLTAPYSISWNTTSTINGNYTLTARARDAAGNITTSAGIAVTVNNPTNLIVALNLNEGNGTFAGDISGNSHNGTLVNSPAWGTGKYGQGVNLDGANDYISIGDHNNFTLDPTQSYTWSAWVKNNNFTEWSTVWSQTVDPNNFFYFYAHTSSDPDGGPVTNGISAYWWVNGGSSKLGVHSNNNVLTAGQWSHVAVTYNASAAQASRFTIYVNGVNVTATGDISSVGTISTINTTNIRIGANQPFGEYLNGSVDDVRFYRRLLTSTEIQNDMNTPLPSTIVPAINPVNGSTNVPTNIHVTAVFNVNMDATTINSSTIELRNASNALVPSTVSYNALNHAATLTPSAVLAGFSTYTVRVKGGTSGVKDATGATMGSDFVSSFTTAEPLAIPMTEGPGGPILVVSSASNPFSRYTLEILRAEGLNHFAAADISAVTPTILDNYDVVILGEMTVGSPQVSMLTDWVNAGGTLIAFKPSSLLNSLFGISASTGTLSDRYLLVNTSAGAGVGIVNQTIQYHGSANLHTLNGATSLATLYSSATTATSNPAVTTRTVGANGGKAIAFTYDLPRSIVYTRQGNPAWAGQSRDGQAGPIRSDNLFFGLPAGTGADWIDFNKIAIPQADEQQRLLANIILQGNLHRKPLPRFWYLPRDLKAVVVMTGDDHSNNGTTGRFNQYLTLGPNTAQDVTDWRAVRATSYMYPSTPITNTQAASFQAQGFELALHPTTNCLNYTEASLQSAFSTQLSQFADAYPGVSAPVSSRNHCLVWNDWVGTPKVSLQNGIRFDVNYYYWPESWMLNRPGMFTGSGMPMRFADTDGTMIDVYQGATQMTDETNMPMTSFTNAVLDKAVGPEGYYGVFVTNMHTDTANHTGSNAIIASAQARQVPIISAKQMLTWLDARNNSYFSNINWSNDQLSFTIVARSTANNLKSMVPVNSGTGVLLSITMDGNPVTYTTQTIKGIQYAFFPAVIGIHNYVATYTGIARVVTTEQTEPVKGGDAKSNTTVSETDESKPLGDRLYVNVLPNPGSGIFNLVISSNDMKPVTVRVVNLYGQLIEKLENVASTGILRLGEDWKGGTYFAEIIQGNQRKVVKIIKLN